MKSAKTKIAFGLLDVVAAIYCVWWFHNDCGQTVNIGYLILLSVPIALYNLRSLMHVAVGRIECWICSGLALAAIGMLNVYLVWERMHNLYGIWVGGFVAINVIAGVGVLAFFYSFHWGVPLKFICSTTLRFGFMPYLGGYAVSMWQYWDFYIPGASDMHDTMVVACFIFVLYLLEIILYLRAGWKERTLQDAL